MAEAAERYKRFVEPCSLSACMLARDKQMRFNRYEHFFFLFLFQVFRLLFRGSRRKWVLLSGLLGHYPG